MKNPFKKEPVDVNYELILTGNVEFIVKNKVLKGRIFGKPFSDGRLIGAITSYHCVAEDGTVYDVQRHAIEESK